MSESEAGVKVVWSEKCKVESKKLLERWHSQIRGYYCELKKEVFWDQDAAENSIPLASLDDEEVLERYKSFKKFDEVDNYSDHIIMVNSLYTSEFSTFQWDFWTNLKKGLDGTERIYVRGYKSVPDLLRAVIIGAEGTPYHDGLFFFDLCFPSGYGTSFSSIPLVLYHSGGLCIHPEIDVDGCVTFSPQYQFGLPRTCTMLQLLVYIRDEYLTAQPLLGKDRVTTCPGDGQISVLYNEDTIIRSLKTMVYVMNHPPLHFEDLVVGHFRSRAHNILMACKAYMEGRFLDGKEEERCSLTFRNDVASCIKPLVDAFVRIGARGAKKFLPLSEKKFPLPHVPTIRDTEDVNLFNYP